VIDPSSIAEATSSILDELDTIVPEVYHFVADSTKEEIASYDSKDLIDPDKIKEAAVSKVAAATGKGEDEVKEHVHVSIEDADTVMKEYVLCRLSNIRTAVHDTTTGYSIKVPLRFVVQPVHIKVSYSDGEAHVEGKPTTALRSVKITRGAGELYTWMLRRITLGISATPFTKGGATGYLFNLDLTNLIGFFRPDMSDSTDSVKVNPDGSLSDPTKGLEEP
jgi:hypothetical protein